MDAMNYEYLIRRAHQCGRYGVAGADADTFRGLQSRFVNYRDAKKAIEKNQTPRSSKELDVLLFEYAAKAGEVATHIEIAIEKVLDAYENKLTQEQIEILENCKMDLLVPTIENIEKAIAQTEKVMLEIELYPQ